MCGCDSNRVHLRALHIVGNWRSKYFPFTLFGASSLSMSALRITGQHGTPAKPVPWTRARTNSACRYCRTLRCYSRLQLACRHRMKLGSMDYHSPIYTRSLCRHSVHTAACQAYPRACCSSLSQGTSYSRTEAAFPWPRQTTSGRWSCRWIPSQVPWPSRHWRRLLRTPAPTQWALRWRFR